MREILSLAALALLIALFEGLVLAALVRMEASDIELILMGAGVAPIATMAAAIFVHEVADKLDRSL